MKKSYEDVRDVTTQALADVLLGEQKSLAEYGKILADKLAQRLSFIAAEATIEAIWQTAQGLGALAVAGGIPTTKSTFHFGAAATAAQTAAAAGLGAFAAAGAGRGLAANGGSPDNSGDNAINNAENNAIQNETKLALEDRREITVSANDYQKYVRGTLFPEFQKALDSGASIRIRGGR